MLLKSVAVGFFALYLALIFSKDGPIAALRCNITDSKVDFSFCIPLRFLTKLVIRS